MFPLDSFNLRPNFCARNIMINRRAETGPGFFFGVEYSLADQTFKLFKVLYIFCRFFFFILFLALLRSLINLLISMDHQGTALL